MTKEGPDLAHCVSIREHRYFSCGHSLDSLQSQQVLGNFFKWKYTSNSDKFLIKSFPSEDSGVARMEKRSPLQFPSDMSSGSDN